MYYESTQFITTFSYIFKTRVCSLPRVCRTHLENCGAYKCEEMNNSWSSVWDWTFCQRSQVKSISLTPMWTLQQTPTLPPPQPQLSSYSITMIYSSHNGVRYSPPLFIIIIIVIIVIIIIIIIITTTILILSGVMKSVYRCCENELHIAKVQDGSGSRKVKQTTTRGIRSERRCKGIYSRHNADLSLLN